MDIRRAKQILDSTKEVEVHYQGKPVWIQNVDESSQTARIYPLDNPGQRDDGVGPSVGRGVTAAVFFSRLFLQ